MIKRITRPISDVIAEVKLQLLSEFNIGDKELAAFQLRVEKNNHSYPNGVTMIPISNLSIDYEVQRDVIPKHVINIMKKYDKRLCSPVSACRITDHPTISDDTVFAYDGQQRSVATALLGYTSIPCHVVDTDDPAFPSYAFEELNESGIKRLVPSDIHRNALTRYRLGSRDIKNISARMMQDQFDKTFVDLEDKNTRKGQNSGDNDYFFSHFKYAQKAMALDASGKLLFDILDAITTVFPKREEVDQGVFIGLYELFRLDKLNSLPDGWMIDVLQSAKLSFKSSKTIHDKCKIQRQHISPGVSWSAPSSMSNFLRELYLINNTTNLLLPYHGTGALLQVATNPAPGLFTKVVKA